MSSSSRLAPARRRARFLKVASAGVALAGFGALSVIVRGVHPGSAGTQATVQAGGALSVSNRIAREAESTDSFFQPGSVAPSDSSSPPQATTQTS